MDGEEITIFILSDGTGETAATMVRAALVQYSDLTINIVRCKNVRTEEQIESLIEDVYARKGIIVFTMVSPQMSRKVMDSAAAKGDRKALRDESPTNEQVAFAALMRGVHW